MTIKRASLAGACFAATMAISGAAFATPITLTWDPTQAGLGGNAPFTFDNVTIQDYATLYITPTSATTFSVVESGYLLFSSLTDGGTNVYPAGFNGIPGATSFGLYEAFTTTSVLTLSGGNLTGYFTSVTFSLYGDPNFDTKFSFDPTSKLATNSGAGSNPGNDVLLATGSLAAAPGPNNSVSLINGVPTASVQTSFDENPLEASFFVSPISGLIINLFGTFTNIPGPAGELTCWGDAALCGSAVYMGSTLPNGTPEGVTTVLDVGLNGTRLSPGGGSLTFSAVSVPEPVSISLFGAGLMAMSFGARRRKNKLA